MAISPPPTGGGGGGGALLPPPGSGSSAPTSCRTAASPYTKKWRAGTDTLRLGDGDRRRQRHPSPHRVDGPVAVAPRRSAHAGGRETGVLRRPQVGLVDRQVAAVAGFPLQPNGAPPPVRRPARWPAAKTPPPATPPGRWWSASGTGQRSAATSAAPTSAVQQEHHTLGRTARARCRAVADGERGKEQRGRAGGGGRVQGGPETIGEEAGQRLDAVVRASAGRVGRKTLPAPRPRGCGGGASLQAPRSRRAVRGT